MIHKQGAIVFLTRITKGAGVFFAFGILVGCAGRGWVPYREAMNCHFQTPSKDCGSLYVEAIEENQALPGVHASYGIYLLKNGRLDDAQIEFNQEIKNYPDSKIAVLLVAKPQALADNTATPDNAVAPDVDSYEGGE